MVCLPVYKAGRAEVCKIEKVNDQGAGTISYVRLPDGYLLDCGYGGDAGKRAEFVRDAINVAMKWAYTYPPVGVVESIVRQSLAEEDRGYGMAGPIPTGMRGTTINGVENGS